MDENRDTPTHKLTKKQLRYLPVKRSIDFLLSTCAIVALSPVLAGLAIAIKVDSPGPVLFKQKRVGKNKELFEIYKFRTMRVDTPNDKPTHLLSDPDQYITRVGRFLRRTSLDELAQLFNIWKGQMYIVSTRPALWNQYDLMEERDRYGVHDIAPGLTGWAQINGRDELEIPVKAKLDGEYIEKLSFWMDLKCFLGTIGSVLMHDGVVEGGTGEMQKKEQNTSGCISPQKIKKEIAIGGAVAITVVAIAITILRYIVRRIKYGKQEKGDKKKNNLAWGIGIFSVVETIMTIYSNVKRKVLIEDESNNNLDDITMGQNADDVKQNGEKKKILITGANSYIGISAETWLDQSKGHYEVETLDMLDDAWRMHDFSKYDVIYHVAGIAHADVDKVSDEQKQLYYKVNTELAVEVAKIARDAGVKQFIFMSSMIIYSGCKENIITASTEPKPLNFYGDSKLQADIRIRELETEKFKVVIVRPPMVYGKGSKGNYMELAKLAGKLPVFPIVKNKRSMIHIDNLCQFIKLMIDNEETGIFFPQNKEYTNTSDMVQMIAQVKGHRIIMIPATNWAVRLLRKVPGKIGNLATKAFGDSIYDMEMSNYKAEYRVHSFGKSIRLTESSNESPDNSNKGDVLVSIVTVSFNSETTIRDTIESVLNQNYDRIEYIIVDGCSTDNTVSIAHEYDDRFEEKGYIYRIISEKDNGIYDAMNKGIKLAQGGIIGIINSDDWYEQDAILNAVNTYKQTSYNMFYGDIRIIKKDGTSFVKHSKMDKFPTSRHWNHPTTFITKMTYDELGLYRNEGIHDDFDLILRIRKAGKKIVVRNVVMANFRLGGTSNDKSWTKCKERCNDRYRCYRNNGYSRLYILECVAIEAVKYVLG